jgi:hypothetical protein
MRGFMKYALEMDSGAMIYEYILSFRKIVSAIRKSMEEGGGYTSHKPIFIFFLIRKVG